MGIHQYIGARYVPKFSDVNGGDWDNQYSYEALTIVKNGLDWYMSKIPVPVGADISDSTYWVQTGNYNGAISALDTRIKALEEIVTKLTYDSVADMAADPDLVSGDLVEVLRYYGTGSGGGGKYIILNSGESYDVALTNGLYARLLHDGSVTAEQFGALADDNTDNTTFIQNADDYCDEHSAVLIFAGSGYYKCSGTIAKSIWTTWSGTVSGHMTNYSDNLRATLVYTGSGDFIIITASGGNEYGEYGALMNLRIQGIMPYVDGTRGIVLSGAVRTIRWENLMIRFFKNGITLTGGEHIFNNVFVWYCKYCVIANSISDSIFRNSQFGSGTGLDASLSSGFGIQLLTSRNIQFIGSRLQHAQAGNGGVINGCANVIFSACIIDGNEAIGLQIVNCNSVSIVGCEFHDNDRHVYILGTGDTCQNVIIGDCMFIYYDSTSSTGIVMQLGGGGTVEKVIVHDCTFYQILTALDKNVAITTDIKIHDNIGLADQ